ncbi:unnamed protein product [Miscanthus lutarioriparius]|uniref:Uncharacterized protein n=1 Tax=Miscanthus lutarioriparius TaxID=422564 RepID=A0A811RRI5_9POAL|nr:unnamed protein product [Miscanthus lutarioriparius]
MAVELSSVAATRRHGDEPRLIMCPRCHRHTVVKCRSKQSWSLDQILYTCPDHNKRSRRREEGDREQPEPLPEPEKMKTFDPWPVFFRREWRRNWPFLTGFAITGFLITKMTANFTEEDLKNSKFVQEHKRH